MTRHEAMYRIPLNQAWCFHAWSIENDPWINVERSGKGFIAQEIERRSDV